MRAFAGSCEGWNRFLGSLCFEQPLEFNEGDIGLAGGIAITEPASVNPTSVDQIKRYGGTTSSEKPWPEEPEAVTDEDKFLRLEKLHLGQELYSRTETFCLQKW